MDNATSGIDKLRESVDTLIVIPNDKLLEIVDRRTSMPEALRKADEVLQQGVQGITDLINVPGLINLDFADVKTVMRDKGIAHIGIGFAAGDDKCLDAVKEAISSPLLETTINGATHVILNVSGDVSLIEAHEAASLVRELAGEDANIIFGAVYDETLTDEVMITVIATGIMEPKNYGNNISTPTFINNTPVTNNYSKANTSTQSNSSNTSNTNFDFKYRQPSTNKAINKPSFLTEQTNKTIHRQKSDEIDNNKSDNGEIKIPEFLQKNRQR